MKQDTKLMLYSFGMLGIAATVSIELMRFGHPIAGAIVFVLSVLVLPTSIKLRGK